jgi:hypothetical protein
VVVAGVLVAGRFNNSGYYSFFFKSKMAKRDLSCPFSFFPFLGDVSPWTNEKVNAAWHVDTHTQKMLMNTE